MVQEMTQLCEKMCVADAAYGHKMIQRVQELQTRCSELLQQLSDEIRSISDRESVMRCLFLCDDIIQEMKKDMLAVGTESVMKNRGIATESMVYLKFCFQGIIFCS